MTEPCPRCKSQRVAAGRLMASRGQVVFRPGKLRQRQNGTSQLVSIHAERVERAGRRWGDVAARVPDMVRESGHGPGSRLVFLDHIPGPCCHLIKPGEEEPHYDEWEDYKQQAPGVDWGKQFKDLDQRLTVTEETRSKSWPAI